MFSTRRWRVLIPPGRLKKTFAKSSGPGGQSMNSSDSKVTLSFNIESDWLPPDLRALLKKQYPQKINNRNEFFQANRETPSATRNVELGIRKIQTLLDDLVTQQETPEVDRDQWIQELKKVNAVSRARVDRRAKSKSKERTAHKRWSPS